MGPNPVLLTADSGLLREEAKRLLATKEKSSELAMGKTQPEVVRRVPRDNSVPSDPQHPPT